MLYRVDFSLEPWRWVFQILYKRIEDFALSHDNTAAQAKLRMLSLLAGDSKVCLLVEADSGDISKISAHALCVIQISEDNGPYIFVEQIQGDEAHNETFVKDCITYAETVLAPACNAKRLVMTTLEPKYRAFKKKYGFKAYRVIMTKELGGQLE